MTGKHFFQHKQGDENEEATVDTRESKDLKLLPFKGCSIFLFLQCVVSKEAKLKKFSICFPTFSSFIEIYCLVITITNKMKNKEKK